MAWTIQGDVDRLIRNVRRHIGEATANEWSDTEIVDAANEEQPNIYMDVLLPADKGYGDYSGNVDYVADQEMYDLPHGFIRLYEGSILDDDGLKLYDLDVIERDEKHAKAGIFVEGRKFGIAPIPESADSDAIKIYFARMPVPAHTGTAAAFDATSITFADTPTIGYKLTDANAYLGARVRALTATTNAGEIAEITAFAAKTGVATLAWDNLPTGTLTYEVMPDLPEEARPLWYMKTAWNLLMDKDAGSRTKLELLASNIKRAEATLLHVAMNRTDLRTQPLWVSEI